LAALDFIDEDPGVGPHGFAIDGGDRIGDPADQLLLLRWSNGILDERRANERHNGLLEGDYTLAVS
jgi:hypothetical protein